MDYEATRENHVEKTWIKIISSTGSTEHVFKAFVCDRLTKQTCFFLPESSVSRPGKASKYVLCGTVRQEVFVWSLLFTRVGIVRKELTKKRRV